MITKLLAILLSAAPASNRQADERFPPPSGTAAEAMRVMYVAKAGTPEELMAAVEKAIDLLSPNSPAGERLQQAFENDGGQQGTSSNLSIVVQEVLEELSFEPLREAELPEGFPTFTPSGAIEVKTYPKNRRAEAKGFFTIFAHITANRIAMTAPVRMEYRTLENGDFQQKSMAFYYPTADTGESGAQGAVETVDDSGETVVALGRRGGISNAVVKDGEARLKQWLEAHPEYEVAGDLIVMGYNSPMVPDKSSFMEVQQPIRPKNGE